MGFTMSGIAGSTPDTAIRSCVHGNRECELFSRMQRLELKMSRMSRRKEDLGLSVYQIGLARIYLR